MVARPTASVGAQSGYCPPFTGLQIQYIACNAYRAKLEQASGNDPDLLRWQRGVRALRHLLGCGDWIRTSYLSVISRLLILMCLTAIVNWSRRLESNQLLRVPNPTD